jgi:DNA-binding response OmpR family regulator
LDADCREVKIIFLTGKGREVDITKGLSLGADAYIAKPFSNTELVNKISELLEGTNEVAGK